MRACRARRRKLASPRGFESAPGMHKSHHLAGDGICGAKGIRTPDLLIANETRYQLRHSPSVLQRRRV